jgi:carbonic anhydrase
MFFVPHILLCTASLISFVGSHPLQVPFSSLNTSASLHTIEDLHKGNELFRQKVQEYAQALVDDDPSFMFLGCLDNRLSSSTIFNSAVGSIVSQNNIANQYSSNDPNAVAAVAYAIESLSVQHIIVLGHYGCKGVETAITRSKTTSSLVRSWVKPISELYSMSRRQEIVVLRDSRLPRRGLPDGIKAAPPANDAGYRALVEENIKQSVGELRKHNLLTKRYSSLTSDESDVFVHGFVYDEDTGEVHDLNISFGPPGKPIPSVPFKAIAAAKNFHRDSDRPGITKGRAWMFN